MNNIKVGLFDLFGHILPGCILLFSLSLPFCREMKNINFLFDFLNSISLSFIGFYLLFAYILSTSLHFFGYRWFKYFGRKIWRKRSCFNGEEKLKHENFSNLHVHIREFSPSNQIFLDEWIAKRAMSFNLSFSFLILPITTIIKVFQINKSVDHSWFMILFISIICSIFTLKKAVKYHHWYYDDIYQIVCLIQIQRGITIFKNQTNN